MNHSTPRAAVYLRCSSDSQTTDQQRMELTAAAEARGWPVVAIYDEPGVSGGNDRYKRPRFNAMLVDAFHRKFDVLMVWSVDRMGRSSVDLANALAELQRAGVDVFLLMQAVDTGTPHGMALFNLAAFFAEAGRVITQANINAGLARVRETGRTKSGRPIGRPAASAKTEAEIRDRLQAGTGILRISRDLGVGSSTVQRVKREMAAA